MLRIALIVAVLLLSAAAAALETPLVLLLGGNTVVINPTLGTMTLYKVETTSGIEAKVAVGNFLSDLKALNQRIEDEQDGIPYSTLRLGAPTCEPSYAGLLAKFEEKLTDADKKAARESQRMRVRRAEDAFWSTEHKYDGVARVASSNTFLGILVPSFHAFLLYEMANESFELRAWRTYGLELAIEAGFNTDPSVSSLLVKLPQDKRKEAADTIEGLQAGAGGIAGKDGKVAPTPSGDAWLAAQGGGTFAVLDLPTLRLITYLWNGKKLVLAGVRNVGVDLALPAIFGDHISSKPLDKDKLKAYEKSRDKLIKAYGIDTDPLAIKALVGSSQTGAKGAQLNGLTAASLLTLDFTDKRLLATYDLNGGQQLKLVSVRDYTIDVGLAMLDQQFREKEQAILLLEAAGRLASRAPVSAIANLRYALSLDPALFKRAEKELSKAFAKNPDFQPIIDEAAKKAKELEEAAKARAKAVEEARRRAAGGN